MIHFLCTKRGAHTFKDYFQDWAGDLAQTSRVWVYENFLRWPQLASGVWIFSDLERLTEEQMQIFQDVAVQLQQLPGTRVLNHPVHVHTRPALLALMHSKGINRFRAYPVTQLPEDARFPLFLRRYREHFGPDSRLIPDLPGFRQEVLRLALSGIALDELLAIEYCETQSADGWYRKYAAFRIGEHIIPGHMIFSPNWVAKDGATSADHLEEENAFLQSRAHEAELRRLFKLAHIDYGRIDYSLIDGHIQVWEINTNPVLLKTREAYAKTAPLELPAKDKLAVSLRDSFIELAAQGGEDAVLKSWQLPKFMSRIKPVSARRGKTSRQS